MKNLLGLKAFIPLVIFIVIAIFLWKGLRNNHYEIPSPLVNKKFPAFEAESLQDPHERITNQEFMGHVTVLNIFATWCVSCQAEHPLLLDIANDKSIRLYGLDYKDNRAKALEWLDKYGNPYQKVIYDPSGKFGIDLGIYGTPETFVIDSKGIIRYKHIGAIGQGEWKKHILPIIAKLSKDKKANK